MGEIEDAAERLLGQQPSLYIIENGKMTADYSDIRIVANAALTDAAQSIDLNDRLHKAEREAATFLNQLLAANKRADQAAAELAAARAEVEQLTAERDAWRELADNVLGPWTQLADDPYNKHWIERFGLTVVYPEWEAEYRRLMALSTAPATARPEQEGAER